MVQVGPGDLSASYGRVGSTQDPEVGAAIREVAAVCRKAGVALAMTAGHRAYSLSLAELREMGCHMFIVGSDSGLLAGALRDRLARLKGQPGP